jgi:hypothetical protein
VALVRERTVPTERPLLVDEVSAAFLWTEGVDWSARWIPYGRNLGYLDQTSLIQQSQKISYYSEYNVRIENLIEKIKGNIYFLKFSISFSSEGYMS